MGVILDSSEIIALGRRRGLVESLVDGREDEPFGISVVTVSELLHGVERADTETRKIRRHAFVEKIIEMIPVFPFDSGVARIYARIWATLMQRGFTVRTPYLSEVTLTPSRFSAALPPLSSYIKRRSVPGYSI